MNDNKLIAEFMGYKLAKCNRGQAWKRPTLSSIHDNYKLHGRLWREKDSYYKWDTSWDWLKPVIATIKDNSLDEYHLIDRIDKADLSFPIIITKKGGKFIEVLDGNHRLQKAVDQDKPLKAKVLNLDDAKTPENFKKMFGGAG